MDYLDGSCGLGARVVPYFALTFASLRLPLRRLPASECMRITARHLALNKRSLLIRPTSVALRCGSWPLAL